MKDRLGRRLRAHVTLTVILLDGERAVRRLRTPAGKWLTAEGTDALLDREAERVEKYFPGREFRLVPLRDGNFNFCEVKSEVKKDPADAELAAASLAPAV
jgi:hypothetical protein